MNSAVKTASSNIDISQQPFQMESTLNQLFVYSVFKGYVFIILIIQWMLISIRRQITASE
jgi:hypothetical protein